MKRTPVLLTIALLLASSVALVACDDSADQLITPTPPPVATQNPRPVGGGGGGGGAQTPKVSRLEPRNESTQIPADGLRVMASFDKALEESTIHIRVVDSTGQPIAGQMSYQEKTVSFAPEKRFAYGTTFTATISREAKSTEGKTLEADIVWTFATAATPFVQPADQESLSVKLDQQKNIYVVGYTNGTMGTLLSGDARPASATDLDGFLLKYNARQEFLWGKRLRTAEKDVARDVAIDSDGNIYVAGYTEGAFVANRRDPDYDFFVIKFSPDGDELWKYQNPSIGIDIVQSIFLDQAGTLYVVGSSNGGDMVDRSKQRDPAGHDIFVLKLNRADGSLLDGILQGSISSGNERVAAAVLDDRGYIHITGYTDGRMHLATIGALSLDDIYWVRIRASDLAFISVRQFSSVDYRFIDRPRGIDIDNQGNAYIVGSSDGGIDRTGYGGTEQFTNRGGEDQIVIKYSETPNPLTQNVVWARQSGTSEIDRYIAVRFAPDGSIVIAGETLHADNTRSISIERVSAIGVVLQTRTFFDRTGSVQALELDDAGNIYLTGFTTGSLDGTAADGRDIYLMKLAPDLSTQ